MYPYWDDGVSDSVKQFIVSMDMITHLSEMEAIWKYIKMMVAPIRKRVSS